MKGLQFSATICYSVLALSLSIVALWIMASTTVTRSAYRHAWKPGNLPPGVGPRRRSPPLFDALTSTAHALQKLMEDGKLKSTDLVEEYVWRIEEHNLYLQAVSEYAPGAIQRAKEMDLKRASGEILGPLHGIPIIIKNNINTFPVLGMDTTAGAVALIGAKPAKNAEVVERLLAAGVVIIGKATVSELNFHKGVGLPCGWSAIAGQGQSAYVRGGVKPDDAFGGHSNPGGSSSGSAIAVSAGFAPIAVGTDSEASITAPSIRAAVYGMRPSHGIASPQGIVPMGHSFDTPGPMAKDARDLADLLTLLVDSEKTQVPAGGYASALTGTWEGIKVGTLDPRKWQYPESLLGTNTEAMDQIIRDTEKAYTKIAKLAQSCHQHIELRLADDFSVNGSHSIYTMIDHEFKQDIDDYLADLKESNVKSLKDLVAWNIEHSEDALTTDHPDQQQLTNSLNSNLSPDEIKFFQNHYKDVGDSMDAMLEKYDIDIILAPGDCFMTQYASAKALPLTTLDFNGRPIGIQAIASAHKEVLLVKFMSAWEATFSPRPLPIALRA